jgi:hypothetical protein
MDTLRPQQSMKVTDSRLTQTRASPQTQNLLQSRAMSQSSRNSPPRHNNTRSGHLNESGIFGQSFVSSKPMHL